MTEEITEELDGQGGEEAAFNAATDALVPTAEENPLEPKEVPEGVTEGEGESEGEAEGAESFFIGDMTEEQVLDRLSRMEKMEEELYEKVSQKVFGKFGEIGQQLKALQAREFKFDPEKLSKLREVDEGIAEALQHDLMEALSGQSFDPDAIAGEIQKSVMGTLNPYVEQRLMTALVPDAQEVVQSDEFSDWFFSHAKQEVRDLFQAWDNQTQMDGVAMAQAFRQFKDWKDAKEGEKETKKENLARAVEGKPSGGVPSGRKIMSEEEAFLAALKESR